MLIPILVMGIIAVGQFAIGAFTFTQFGVVKYLWSIARKDPEAVDFFYRLGEKIGVSLNPYLRK